MSEEIELVNKDSGTENGDRVLLQIEEEPPSYNPEQPIREHIGPISVKREIVRVRPPALAFLDRWTTSTNFIRKRSYIFEGFSPWLAQIEKIEAKFGTGTGSYFRFLRRLFILNVFVCIISSGLILGPQLAHDILHKKWPIQDFKFLDVFAGSGYLTETILFYGHYNSSVTFFGKSTFGTSYVYFYTTMSIYFLSILFTTITMATLYRKIFIDYAIAIDSQFYFTNKVLCAWDAEIKTSYDAKHLKYKTSSDLKESLEGLASRQKVTKKSLIIRRIIFNIVIIFILVLAGYFTSYTIDLIGNKSSPGSITTELKLSYGITIALYILPFIFSHLGKMEKYESFRNEMYLGLVRSFLLEKIFFITIFIKAVEKSLDAETCWEDFIGRSIYQLEFAYILILLIGNFVIECLHHLLHLVFPKVPSPEFDISRNSVHLIYSQSVAMIGYYFVPGISLFMIISSILTFYIKMLSLKYNCSKSQSPWRASKSQAVFLVYTFLSTLLSITGYLYAIIRLQPSKDCGPYREFRYSYEIMGEASFFKDFFMFKPAFIAGVILVLTILIYYIQSLNTTYKNETKKLKEEIYRGKAERKILKHLLAST